MESLANDWYAPAPYRLTCPKCSWSCSADATGVGVITCIHPACGFEILLPEPVETEE